MCVCVCVIETYYTHLLTLIISLCDSYLLMFIYIYYFSLFLAKLGESPYEEDVLQCC